MDDPLRNFSTSSYSSETWLDVWILQHYFARLLESVDSFFTDVKTTFGELSAKVGFAALPANRGYCLNDKS